MAKVTVYHPQNPEINSGYTVFSGENIEVIMEEDGSLTIGNWETNAERGAAYFARGSWAYACVSEPREDLEDK